jgi:hypothetical protein
LEISYEVLSKKIFSDSFTKDISQGGIRFFTQEFIAKDSLLKIRLVLKKIHFSFETYVRVVWVQKEAHSGRYEIGVEFTNIPMDAAKLLVAYLANIVTKE